MAQINRKESSVAARVAQILSLTFVLVSSLHLTLALVRTGDTYMLRYLGTQLSFWVTLVGSIYVGLRITRQDQVAWWIALAGACFLLYQRIGPLRVSLSERFMFLPLGITLLWLTLFVVALVIMRFENKTVAIV